MRFLFFMVLLASPFGFVHAQKIKVEDIIARHIESIGSKEKIAASSERLAMGVSSFESKLPKKKTEGKAVIASNSDNLMFLTSFNSQEYPMEKIGLFANKVNLPWVTSGRRSPLGAFIADHEKILSDGLFAGSMSSMWAMLNLEKTKARVVSSGTRSVGERRAYVLDYFPSGGGSTEFTIKLFFDAETYRHVRSEYLHVIASKQDVFGQLGRQAGVRLRLIESFGDFKDAHGLTIPHSYQAEYMTDSNQGVYEFVWDVTVGEYKINPKLAPDFFKFTE